MTGVQTCALPISELGDPHARRAAVEPEPKNVLVLGPHVRVRPVEVGLLGREQVEVPLAGRASLVGACPRGTAEDRLPAVRRKLSVGPGSGPEPEAFPLSRPGRRGEGGAKPRVLVGDVVRNDVDDRADPESRGLGDQLLRFLQCPEGRIDRPVVRDVVTPVGQRRRVPRAEPEGVDSEIGRASCRERVLPTV